ncbi:MAG TPA: hypothetical protein VHB30_12715 [Solirubrobacteraceae bacterium]|jgi:hypothetical protein|nr:hypothetical protein [Solirubrobacteraceae bacterium]
MPGRKLIVVTTDLFVRSFVRTGALSAIDDDGCFWAVRAGIVHEDEIREHPRFAGAFEVDERRAVAYLDLRHASMARRRRLSRTMDVKIAKLAKRSERLRYGVLGLPGVFERFERRVLGRLGLNEGFQRILREVDPELVVAPVAGTEAAAYDLERGASAVGARTVLLVNGWDNVSSKAYFPVLPDLLGVWGDQSVEHAVAMHGIPRERAVPIGVPTFEGHFAWDPASSASPYDFPYVLFAGCAIPFDERTALRRVAEALDRAGSDAKIVYRPHPWRQPRRVDDTVAEGEFGRVVIDRQVRERYLEATGRMYVADGYLPSLDYYPALLGFARCVVCPLSTMMVEAAIVETPVVALAYDDRVHDIPPSLAAEFEHFQGMDDIDGFEVVRDLAELDGALARAGSRPATAPSLREQISYWLYSDDRPYSERLAALLQGEPAPLLAS